MSDALPLPPRPSLEQYKKRAKDLVKICKSGDRDALRAWAREWIEALVQRHDLEVTLPRERERAYTAAEIGYLSERTAQRIEKHLGSSDSPSLGACTLAQAQLALA